MKALFVIVPALALGGCSCSFHAGTNTGTPIDNTVSVNTSVAAPAPAAPTGGKPDATAGNDAAPADDNAAAGDAGGK